MMTLAAILMGAILLACLLFLLLNAFYFVKEWISWPDNDERPLVERAWLFCGVCKHYHWNNHTCEEAAAGYAQARAEMGESPGPPEPTTLAGSKGVMLP